ncbi:MAG: long-chain fatty acid--CoA ligase [Promethearchaeota archaeon]|nr:MAG: long-chain fatty acid--CoA ligase [Candidatus Lokiarchaeota archaeon]
MNIPELKLLWKYVEYWAEQEPDFPVIRYKKKMITAKELNEKTDKLAMAFLDLGLQKGDPIVTILPTIPEFVISFIAASKMGALTIPFDKEYKMADFKSLIPHSNPKIIISINKWQKNKIADNLQELSSEFKDIQYLMVGKHELGSQFEEVLEKDYDLADELKRAKLNQTEEDCTLIIWTGGTTGAPKAVEISHLNFVQMCLIEYNFVFGNLKKYGYKMGNNRIKHLVNLPVSHVGGTIEILGTGIIGGLEMILQASWSPWDALKAMKEHGLPFMGGVPTMFKIFLSLPDLDTYTPKEFLKLVVLSGEKVSYELIKGINKRICENIAIGYGSTEAGAEVTFTEVINTEDGFKKIAEGYVGKALPGMKIKIVDENHQELSQGEIGEIITTGPLTSKSYYKMPEENKKGFTEDGWCKTGDLGYLNENDELFITGRIKEIIRVGAYTVLPAEIEELVLSHPKVAIAAAIGAPDDIKGEVVWLVIGPELGVKFNEEDKNELLRKCEENLAKFKVPQKIIIYPLDPNDLPITRIGKVDKVRLKKELLPK